MESTSVNISSLVNVRQCIQCQGDTEYHCLTCVQNLCHECKEMHSINLDSIHHSVILYRNKYNNLTKREKCTKHPDQTYGMYCEHCDTPFCLKCNEHNAHETIDIKVAYETKREEQRDTVMKIRCETLYYLIVLLHEIYLKSDLSSMREKLDNQKLAMIEKSRRLKDALNNVPNEVITKGKSIFIQKLGNQMTKVERMIGKLQTFEHEYEMSARRPFQFLRLVKNTGFPITQKPICRLSLSLDINIKNVVKLLSAIQLSDKGKRHLENEHLLELMPSPLLRKSCKMAGVKFCYHISCITPDRFWANDNGNNLSLTDTTKNEAVHLVTKLCDSAYGSHTLTNDSQLIYIDLDQNIYTLSHEMETKSIYVRRTDSNWIYRCVYFSPVTEDLLVGMRKEDRYTDMIATMHIYTGKVTRYNKTGQLTKSIQLDSNHHPMYRDPCYITENNNGDIVVSDWRQKAVVVTESEGSHRFSFKGHPPGSKLSPRGICTDVLSHILVCDCRTNTIQMVDKDGQFLLYLLTNSSSDLLTSPRSLHYDTKTQILWVASYDNNTVSAYRYLNRHLRFFGKTR